jgi:hypothetical protein
MKNKVSFWSSVVWFLLVSTVMGNSVYGQESPVEIGAYRNLFVDDYIISSTSNLNRQVHQPTKCDLNPLIGPTDAWEMSYKSIREGTPFPFVDRDETTGKFRLWYAGYTKYTLPSGTEVRFPACYAESDDGINWTKPNLGLYSYIGSTDNNIVIPAGNIWGVIKEPDDPDPNRLYKAMVWHEPEYAGTEGYFIYTSPDGIHWNRETPLDQPVLNSIYHEDLTDGLKQTTVELTSSRNGRNWDRVGTQGLGEGRQEFMSVGEDGSWDDNYHDPCSRSRLVMNYGFIIAAHR